MRLGCALVACNENTHYLDFWPIVKESWWRIVGVPVIMVYVGEELPEHLKGDPAVRFFKSIPEWPTATQAQVIRLLYPALLQTEDAVVISDMDIVPLQKDFFVDGFSKFRETQFVSLRGIDENEKQIYMCYVGATPKVWGEFFHIKTEEDIRVQLTTWASQTNSDGLHGGEGWCTDQEILYRKVKDYLSKQNTQDCIGIIPWTQEIPRLDRGAPWEWTTNIEATMLRLTQKYYIDFHMPPYQHFKDYLHAIIGYTAENQES